MIQNWNDLSQTYRAPHLSSTVLSRHTRPQLMGLFEGVNEKKQLASRLVGSHINY
ncbi:hypothetical protein SAMN02745866_00876 [Alteromonadaceae bacterium Bs31]|nr:hypothetical protein SAMN02745866_00876 [Alteromonadaceae bacterium Bs31]